MYPAEHERLGFRMIFSRLGQHERVTHKICVLDDLVTLIKVAQNLQAVTQFCLGCHNASIQLSLGGLGRSEEHTSELQSRGHLVCRLLLEKKNKKARNDTK